MKKTVLFFAAMAAMATVSLCGCSNDEDLTQIPEESTPLKMAIHYGDTPSGAKSADSRVAVNSGDAVLVNATRGTDFSATNPISECYLYSTVSGGSTAWLTGGKLTATTDDKWLDVSNKTLTWSGHESNTYDFYFLSDEVSDASFTTTPRTFSYTIGDYATQKDLIVGTGTGDKATNDNGSNIAITGTHALARVSKLYINFKNLHDYVLDELDAASLDDTENDADMGYLFIIGGIVIHDLKISDTYQIGTGWSGSATGASDGTQYNIPLTLSSGTTYGTFADRIWASETPWELSLSNGGIYILPQTVNGVLNEGTLDYNITGPYVEFKVKYGHSNATLNHTNIDQSTDFVWNVPEAIGVDFSDETIKGAEYGSIYAPINFVAAENGDYYLYIDISKSITDPAGGEGIFEGVEPNVM